MGSGSASQASPRCCSSSFRSSDTRFGRRSQKRQQHSVAGRHQRRRHGGAAGVAGLVDHRELAGVREFCERPRHVQGRAQVEAPVDQDSRDVGQLLDIGWREALDRVAVAWMFSAPRHPYNCRGRVVDPCPKRTGRRSPTLTQASSRTCPTNLNGRPRTRIIHARESQGRVRPGQR